MNSLVWFRKDLRIADNISLTRACENPGTIGIYCFDPRQYANTSFGFKKTEKYRAQFLRESVKELRYALQQKNITLLVYFDRPEVVIPKVTALYNINRIYTHKEWTKEEVAVNKALEKALPPAIEFIESFDNFLFHPDDLPFSSINELPRVFTAFRKKCEQHTSVRIPLPAPATKPQINMVDHKTVVPTLSELGLIEFETDSRTAFPFKGGETQALQHLEHYFWKSKAVAQYKRTRNSLLGANYSSKFSAWLANGSLSPRTVYASLKAFEVKVIKNEDTYWLFFELIWRDFFRYVSLKHGNNIFNIGGILNRPYEWARKEHLVDQWINGRTEKPFVNANMIELKRTGFMSNRGRQNVASFWAKELQQDWRIGAAYFESMLIDYDVHSNWCNWMYLSGVGNDPRDRKFNIERQAEIYDGKGIFQKLWL